MTVFIAEHKTFLMNQNNLLVVSIAMYGYNRIMSWNIYW